MEIIVAIVSYIVAVVITLIVIAIAVYIINKSKTKDNTDYQKSLSQARQLVQTKWNTANNDNSTRVQDASSSSQQGQSRNQTASSVRAGAARSSALDQYNSVTTEIPTIPFGG